MKMLLSLALVLLATSAKADEWAKYGYLGNCEAQVAEGEDGAKFDFYAADLSFKGTTTGFSVVTVTQGDETGILGGYDATYALNTEKTEMTVVVEGATLVVPFGKNVEVVSDEQKFICNTKLSE